MQMQIGWLHPNFIYGSNNAATFLKWKSISANAFSFEFWSRFASIVFNLEVSRNLVPYWTKLKRANVPFTDTRMNAFRVSFIRQYLVRSVHVHQNYERIHELSCNERVQAQHYVYISLCPVFLVIWSCFPCYMFGVAALYPLPALGNLHLGGGVCNRK